MYCISLYGSNTTCSIYREYCEKPPIYNLFIISSSLSLSFLYGTFDNHKKCRVILGNKKG